MSPEPRSDDLRCPECGRTYDDPRPSCGIVHAITAAQIIALRKMVAALFTPRRSR